MSTWTLCYHIDAQNVLTARTLGEGTSVHLGEATDPLGGTPGTLLKELLHCQGKWHLYENVLDNVRATGNTVEIPFCHDSPVLRRRMTVRAEPLQHGEIALWIRVDHTERFREPIPLLDNITPRNGQLLAMCAWCKDIRMPDGIWREIEEAARRLHLFCEPTCPSVTHTICPDCYNRLIKSLDGLDTAAGEGAC